MKIYLRRSRRSRGPRSPCSHHPSLIVWSSCLATTADRRASRSIRSCRRRTSLINGDRLLLLLLLAWPYLTEPQRIRLGGARPIRVIKIAIRADRAAEEKSEKSLARLARAWGFDRLRFYGRSCGKYLKIKIIWQY